MQLTIRDYQSNKTFVFDLDDIQTYGQLKKAVFKKMLNYQPEIDDNYDILNKRFMTISKNRLKRLFSIDINDDKELTEDIKNEITKNEWVLQIYRPLVFADDKLPDKGYKPQSFFHSESESNAIDQLKKDLNIYNKKNNCVVFIGLGSYDYGDKESCYRQQFPQWLEKMEQQERHILLIDPNFNKNSNYKQIYEYDRSFQLQEENKNGCKKYFSKEKNIYLYTYPTSIEDQEYNGTAKTLAGQDLIAIGESLRKRGGALVSGNFYKENRKPFVCIGIQENDLRPSSEVHSQRKSHL